MVDPLQKRSVYTSPSVKQAGTFAFRSLLLFVFTLFGSLSIAYHFRCVYLFIVFLFLLLIRSHTLL